jgi:hypothetical protein
VTSGAQAGGAILYSHSGDGRAFSPRIRVPTLAGRDPEHIQLVRAGARGLLVAWDEVVGGHRTIVASRVTPAANGASVDRPVVVSEGRQARHPALTTTMRGVLVAWTDGAADAKTTIGVRTIGN